MEVIDFEQLPQHDFDLRVRDEADKSPQLLMDRYYAMLTGDERQNVSLDDFEKLLSGLIGTNASHVALLHELNFTSVEPLDAQMILSESIIPNDDILDTVAGLRAGFDEAAEAYAEQLRETGKTFVAPVDPNPTEQETDAAIQRLARYVITSVLVDDREADV